ncbi:hypothetical protein WHR41_02720 [Cladosporium halotolerans]|uniref:Uncharacterized protein n=1 Tax=Cladosporium halotolerans TaxID=1052096 RepID=A0AB34KYF6_9PEZI
MIAVSSILSLDIYRTYSNPTASDRKTLQVSHLGVVFHGAFMAGFALMLNYAGATNNWTTYFRPIIACPAIFPLMFTILWSGQTKAAAILSPVLGLLSGLLTWFVLSWHWGGAINIHTTQHRFDWRIFLQLDLIEEKVSSQTTLPSTSGSENEVASPMEGRNDKNEKNSVGISGESKTPSNSVGNSASKLDDVVHPMSPETLHHIRKWLKIASVFFVVNVVVTLILWPLPLYRDWIFTRSFFFGWVTTAIIWHFGAMAAVIVYPCYDGWNAIATSIQGVASEIKGPTWKRVSKN